MTVCVAVIASSGKEIVAASDSMMSYGAAVTGETSLKYNRVHERWAIMLAGDDIHPAEPIIRELSKHLIEHERPTVAQVEAAIRVSWRIVKNQRAETQVLSAYDLDLKTFMAEGRETFGELGFSEVRSAIERASEFSCELLVCGFDDFDTARIFLVVHPGEPVEFTRLGFAAIGSGRDSAIASLMWDPPHHTYDTTEKAVYRVAAAKFMAETALGVGKETIVFGLRPDGHTFVLTIADIQKLRELWHEKGRPRLPRPSDLAMLGGWGEISKPKRPQPMRRGQHRRQE